MGRLKNCFWMGVACLAVNVSAGVTDVGNLKVRAEQGDIGAQEAVARYYDLNRQYSEALDWYLKAANSGRAESQYRLGLILLEGKEPFRVGDAAVPADPENGLRWLRRSAGQNHVGAQEQLARSYDQGIGAGQDPAAAYGWTLVAAANGSAMGAETNRLMSQLSPEQIQKAQETADAYLAKLPDTPVRSSSASSSQMPTQLKSELPELAGDERQIAGIPTLHSVEPDPAVGQPGADNGRGEQPDPVVALGNRLAFAVGTVLLLLVAFSFGKLRLLRKRHG